MRVLPSTHPLGKLEACPMRNWLILSNDTLGDTLLSLQLLSLAKKWLKFDEVTLVLPERYSGISELVDGLNVTEVVGGAGVADAKEFDEVLDLECGGQFKSRIAGYRFNRARGYITMTHTCGQSQIESVSVIHLDRNLQCTCIARLEEVNLRLERLALDDPIFESALLSDSALFPEFDDVVLRGMVSDLRSRGMIPQRMRPGRKELDVLLLPGGVLPQKRFSEKFWLEIAQLCVSRNFRVTLIRGPNEVQIGFGDQLRRYCDILEPKTISALCEIMRQHDLAIAHDCGQMHVACQFGMPTIALFSATNPAVWFPYQSSLHRVVGGRKPGEPIVRPKLSKVESAIDSLLAQRTAVSAGVSSS